MYQNSKNKNAYHMPSTIMFKWAPHSTITQFDYLFQANTYNKNTFSFRLFISEKRKMINNKFFQKHNIGYV